MRKMLKYLQLRVRITRVNSAIDKLLKECESLRKEKDFANGLMINEISKKLNDYNGELINKCENHLKGNS